MDAGLAAVLGALAGSVATIGAALATGWSQREAARIAARAEHRRQQRDKRHDVYREFITAAAKFTRGEPTCGLWFYDNAVIVSDGLLMGSESRAEFEESLSQLRAQSVEIALVGPKKTHVAAREMVRLAATIAEKVDVLRMDIEGVARWAIPEQQERVPKRYSALTDTVIKFHEARNDFLLVAQTVLDDDGSDTETL
ncbi:hypothetical protein ACH4OW_23925 [Streptomyces sp. NPDC017056]|uniref:hypothetical protein n=1 Tax=Streptomyces sp. NPDC017056 TaxID=3364973 RepID=UPI0037BD2CF9